MDEFGIETREGNPPELGGSELMPSAQTRSDEPDTSSRGGKGSTKWGATFTEMGGAGHPDFKSGEC